jgi:thermitase
MKREKIIFPFILMPFFLFSLNLNLFKLETGKGGSVFFVQQPASSFLTENPPSSDKKNISLDKDSLDLKTSLSKKIKKENASSGQLNRAERYRIGRSGLTRIESIQTQNPSFSRDRLMVINEGSPYNLNGRRYVPGQVLVKFKPAVPERMRELTISSYQTKRLKRIPALDIYQLQIPEYMSVEEMVYLLRQNPDIELAGPNLIRHISRTPNDPYFVEQYALYNSGQVVGPPGSPQGTLRADIKAIEGWDETIGSEEVVIAVLDSGVDFNHPDLDDKLLSTGYDFVNDDADPTDDNGHGTLVAGIAAAETNNGVGIAGVAWNCKILPIKVADDIGDVQIDDLASGIAMAVENGADIINLSLGSPGSDPFEQAAVVFAYEHDLVVVAAAGNDGGATAYPAAYEECLAVAATNGNDERVTFLNTAADPPPFVPWESNFGPEIDVAAPGHLVFSLYPTDLTPPGYSPYTYNSGTSFSAPHVAGLAALIRSIKPELSAEDIMDVIRYTADDVNSASHDGRDDFIGYGRINMERALVPIIISALYQKR